MPEITLDDKDIRILLGVHNRETLSEMAAATLSQVSKVQYRVDRLVTNGLVKKPKERKARSITLTPAGAEYLRRFNINV